jgi:hypothetical protein
MKKVLLTCAATGLLIAGSSAFAAAVTCPAPVFHPWYVGGGVNYYSGMSEVKVDPIGSTSADKYELDKTKIGWDIFGGYELTPRFGTELGYVDFGTNTWIRKGRSSGIFIYRPRVIKGWLAYFDGIYYVPFCKVTCFVLKVFAKGGADYLNLKYEGGDYFSSGSTIYTGKLHTYGLNIGCGIQAEYNQFGARLGYTDYQAVTFGQKYHMSTTQTGFVWNMTSIPNLLYLDAMYHFG